MVKYSSDYLGMQGRADKKITQMECSTYLQFTYFSSFHILALLPASMAGGETECEVMTQLYLMCPDTAKEDVKIILVNDEHVVLCFDLWKKSSIFDFDCAFQIMQKGGTPCALGML